MNDNSFVDTNVLIYAIESNGPDPAKTTVAVALLRRPNVCLSTQVLGEFYRAVRSPRRQIPLTHEEAIAWVQLWKRFDVRAITVPHVDLALELADRYRINYYDALIIAAARFSDCHVIFSEDLNDGQSFGGVRVENPFNTSN